MRVGAIGAGVRLGVWTGDVASDDAETVNCASTKSLAVELLQTSYVTAMGLSLAPSSSDRSAGISG